MQFVYRTKSNYIKVFIFNRLKISCGEESSTTKGTSYNVPNLMLCKRNGNINAFLTVKLEPFS